VGAEALKGRVKTWKIEAGVVGAVLSLVAFATGGTLAGWITAAAVLLSFMHAQVADRMAEQQEAMPTPSVPCWRWSRAYFLAKEALWLAAFVITGAWPAVAGVVLFLAYPAWRRSYRRRVR